VNSAHIHTSRVINMLTVSLQHFDRKAGVVNDILIEECVKTDGHYPLPFQHSIKDISAEVTSPGSPSPGIVDGLFVHLK